MSNCPSSAAKNKAIHKYFFSEAFFHTMEVFIKDSLKPKWNQDKSFMLFEWNMDCVLQIHSTSDVKMEFFQTHSLKTWSPLPY